MSNGQEWLDEEEEDDLDFTDFEAALCAFVVSVNRKDGKRVASFLNDLMVIHLRELEIFSNLLHQVRTQIEENNVEA